MITRRATLLASAALPLAASTFTRPAAAQQPSTLRIAMTVADIPATDGAPDQGTEGIRFMGYTMYDPLVMWDLSSATEPAKLVPGLDAEQVIVDFSKAQHARVFAVLKVSKRCAGKKSRF